MKKEKENKTNVGEELVKRQLWRNSYSAKDVSKYTYYDLLVNDKIKVEVKRAWFEQSKDGIYWTLKDLMIKPEIADVLAIVITTQLEDFVIYYMKINKRTLEQLNENKMIISKTDHRNKKVTCDIKINAKQLKAFFTDSLAKIFNN